MANPIWSNLLDTLYTCIATYDALRPSILRPSILSPTGLVSPTISDPTPAQSTVKE